LNRFGGWPIGVRTKSDIVVRALNTENAREGRFASLQQLKPLLIVHGLRHPFARSDAQFRLVNAPTLL
jgi:hypothetical protein